MIIRFVLVLIVIGIFLMGVNPPAEAIPISRTNFSSDATLINFDSLPLGTAVDNEFSGLGVVFSSSSGPGGVVTFLAPGQVLSVSYSIVASFTVPVHLVGVDFSSISPLTLEIYNSSDTLLESLTLSSRSGFLGLDAGNELISRVIIHDSGFNFAIDNFTFEGSHHDVPEPASLILLGSGLVGLALWRRMRG